MWQSLASTFLLASCSANAKIVPAHNMTTRVSGGIAPFIFNLGTIWRRVISFMPLLLTPGEISFRTH